jgi:hypothetical protein
MKRPVQRSLHSLKSGLCLGIYERDNFRAQDLLFDGFDIEQLSSAVSQADISLANSAVQIPCYRQGETPRLHPVSIGCLKSRTSVTPQRSRKFDSRSNPAKGWFLVSFENELNDGRPCWFQRYVETVPDGVLATY